MLDHHALWRAGRARGVDHIGGVVRVEVERAARWRAAARSPASRRRAARCWRRAPPRGQPVEQRRLRHQHRRAGVRQHERQPLARVGRVERQIGAAGLEDAEQPDHHLGRALDAQPDHGLGPDAEAAQVMRQLVGVRVELARSSARGPRTPPPPRPACARPAPQTAPAASRRRDRTAPVSFQRRRMVCALGRRPRIVRPPERAIRRPPPPPPAAGSAAGPASRRAASNRSLAYSSTPVDAGRRAVRRRAARPADRQVELRARRSPPARAAPQARQLQARAAGRRSRTPASPGTADAATATAPG